MESGSTAGNGLQLGPRRQRSPLDGAGDFFVVMNRLIAIHLLFWATVALGMARLIYPPDPEDRDGPDTAVAVDEYIRGQRAPR